MPAISSLLSPKLITAIESGAWVIVPTQRSAHRLQLLYANHCVARGLAAWVTPSIRSFDDFAGILWRTQFHDRERVLSVQQSRLLWERIVSESEWAPLLLSPALAANSAFSSWERLQFWRISRDALAAHVSVSDEARALLAWSDRFHALCRQAAWMPEALLPARLLDLETAPQVPFIVTLSNDWHPHHVALFEHLRHLGMRVESVASETQATSVEAIACETPLAELQAAAEWARQKMTAGSQAIAVAIPGLDERAEEVRRVFAETFAQATRTMRPDTSSDVDRVQQESSFSVGSVRMLGDFPIVRSAMDLLQLADDRASGVLAGSVLRSPFLAGSLIEAAARALADRQLRSEKREHYDLNALERLAAARKCSILANSLKQVRESRLEMPVRMLPSAVAERFAALWSAFGWPGERTLDSDEQQIVARLQSCLAEFGALDEILGPLTYGSALREFEAFVLKTRFEPRSAASTITIVDIRAEIELPFDAVWFAGMDETHWPPPAKPDPFIPLKLQLGACMPFASARLSRDYARGRFDRLQKAADTVVFGWARRNEDVELLPAPWLAEIAAHAEARSNSPSYAKRIFAARPPLETLVELTAPGFSRRYARGGARLFELQSQCPFRAFGELRLAARPLDAFLPSIDVRDRGTLIHAALATLWERLQGSDGLRSLTQEQLVSSVRTAVAQHGASMMEGASPHRVRMLQIEQELAAERILALLEIDRGRMRFRVIGRPETKEAITVGSLALELRLDRTDELLDGAYRGGRIIVDYKTGAASSAKGWLRDRPEQPQLPLYAVTHPAALAAVAFATVSAQSVGYRGVARDEGILPGVAPVDSRDLPETLSIPDGEWEGVLSYWRSIIERLAQEFVSGDARVDPLLNACRSCHLSALCRIHEQALVVDLMIDEESA